MVFLKKQVVEKIDRRGTGLMQQMQLSEELQTLVGKERGSRSEIIKDMWKYIKANKLQDPENRRFCYPDAKMAKIFGTKKFFTMRMSKILEDGKHFQKIDAKEVE